MNDTPNVSAATDAALAALTDGGFDYALIGGLAVDENPPDIRAQESIRLLLRRASQADCKEHQAG